MQVSQAGSRQNKQQQAGKTGYPLYCVRFFRGFSCPVVDQPPCVNQKHGQAIGKIAGKEHKEVRQPGTQQAAYVMHLIACNRIKRSRVGRIVTAQTGDQVDRQQNGQYEKTLAEAECNLTVGWFSFTGFLTGLRQADVPYQILIISICVY